MAKNNEYRMAIKIAGEIEKSLYNSTDLTRKELNKIAREAAYTSSITKETFRQGLKETEPFFNGLEKAGITAFKAVATAATAAGAAIISIGTASAKAGIEFESAFTGVKKTTDATAKEYEQIRNEIIGMTREIPATATEIAGVAEAAGQLGIQKEGLLEFSKVMIDLGETTDLAATEAASSLAKFANITKMDSDKYDELGSTIVALGNDFATTESDIVSMGTKLASAGELAGFTEPQIMAMATAMSSVGIEVEAGGSAFSKLTKTIQVAVETGSKDLKNYAKVAGMSTGEFKEAFEKDAVSAIGSFIGGLNEVERNGKSATVILDEMGLTEVRLSNTILSLANADELMLNTIETANKAWEENTALTKEAGLRYETTESKLAIMNNGFKEAGIEISDQFNGPMREGIDIITDLTHAITSELQESNIISEIAQEIKKGVPTAIRQTKQFAEVIGDFAKPFLSVGGWIAGNQGLMEGTIIGIGSAITTYKVVSGISALASSFAALGPASLPIFGLAGAAAIITGVGVAVKKSAAEAKKANLDKHFGNISLSLRELEETAGYIVSNDSLGQGRESISALRELEGIEDSIEDAVSELNRMNWKISIGMKLTEDEQERYQQNITDYIENIQSYIEQEQYAVNLAVGVLTDDDLQGSNIVTQINEFYSGKYGELESLGTDLNNAITTAFTDGLLIPDEVKIISDLQQKMAKIKESLAQGKYEANLDLLGMKYSAGELDADSFKNLQAEINEQMEQARKDYDESYVLTNASARARHSQGKITDAQYEDEIAEYKENYLEQVGSLEAKAASFMTETILKKYDGEIGGIVENMPEALDRTREHIEGMEGGSYPALEYTILTRESGISEMDKNTQGAIKDLWKGLEPEIDVLRELRQKYIDTGEEIPEYISEGINRGLALGLVAKDKDVLFAAFTQRSLDKNYKTNIDKEVREVFDYTTEEIKKQAEKGIEADLDVKINLNTFLPELPTNSTNNDVFLPQFPTNNSTTPQLPNPTIGERADGGIVTKPELTWVAEAGYSESIIPLDGSQNAVNLWKQTGDLLGITNQKTKFSSLAPKFLEDYQSSTSNTVNSSEENNRIAFSPVISINGGSDSREDINKALKQAFTEFEDLFETLMKKHDRNNRRFSFSS